VRRPTSEKGLNCKRAIIANRPTCTKIEKHHNVVFGVGWGLDFSQSAGGTVLSLQVNMMSAVRFVARTTGANRDRLHQ